MADAADRPDSSAPPAAWAGPAAAQGMAWRRRSVRWLLRRFIRLPDRRRWLLLEAVIWLALSRLALLFVPFRVLAQRFGQVAAGRADGGMVGTADADQQAQAVAVGWAVTRAARYVPFRAVCLPQAIAAKAMLSRRRVASVMHFGVAKKPHEALMAHAWLNAGPVEVTGFPVGPEFVEVARFV
ncbi:MAG TPA: lasso peptide biosynthesis B2 protein [Rhizomicrobium sp.]